MLGPGTESVLGPLFRKILRRGGGGCRLTLPETIKCGVFEYNSCNIWLESGPFYSPGPVHLYPLYPPCTPLNPALCGTLHLLALIVFLVKFSVPKRYICRCYNCHKPKCIFLHDALTLQLENQSYYKELHRCFK
jgi:hypothetical protein